MERAPKEIAERNRSSRERLRVIGRALSEAELGTLIDAPWTAGALFAHVGFRDRFVLERWRFAADRGERTPMRIDEAVMDRINDASITQWLAIPPRVAIEEFLAAAAELEDLIAGLDTTIVLRSSRRGVSDSWIAHSTVAIIFELS